MIDTCPMMPMIHKGKADPYTHSKGPTALPELPRRDSFVRGAQPAIDQFGLITIFNTGRG